MIEALEKLIGPRSKDPDVARKEQVLNVVLVVLLVADIGYVVYRSFEWRRGRSDLRLDGAVLAAFVWLALFYWLSRRGHVHLSAGLVITLLFLMVSYLLYMAGLGVDAILIGVLTAVAGGLLVNPPGNWAIAALILLAAMATAFAAQHGLLPPPVQIPVMVTLGIVAVVMFLLPFLTWLSTRELTAALRAAQERMDALQALDEERQRLVADLTATTERQAQLLETVRELSSPVAPVLEGIIVLPLAGHVDEDRAQRISNTLLQGIAEHQAQVVILDVTGLVEVDGQVAERVLRIARSARLSGVEVVLVGVQPEVAADLIGLQLDWSGVVTRTDLRAGVEYALNRQGLRLMREYIA
jgi:anti-anti-sigma regulatory factor